ncbi:MAG: hypothetical protein QM729_21455 [Solirubrobacterales bacterium]
MADTPEGFIEDSTPAGFVEDPPDFVADAPEGVSAPSAPAGPSTLVADLVQSTQPRTVGSLDEVSLDPTVRPSRQQTIDSLKSGGIDGEAAGELGAGLGELHRELVAPVDRFQKKHIDPIVSAWKTRNMKAYQGQPMSTYDRMATAFVPSKGTVRRAGEVITSVSGEDLGADKAQYAFENLARPFIGETTVNEDGSQDPLVRGVLNSEEKRLGTKGVAFQQAFLQGVGKLPIYLIPGVGEENMALQGMTSGAAMGAAEAVLDGNSAAQSGLTGGLFGGTMGAALQGAVSAWKAGKAALKKGQPLSVAPKPAVEHVPVGVVPADEVSKLADVAFEPPTPKTEVGPIPEEVTNTAPLPVESTAPGIAPRSVTVNQRAPSAPAELPDAWKPQATPNPKGGNPVKNKPAPTYVAVNVSPEGVVEAKAVTIGGDEPVVESTKISKRKAGQPPVILTSESKANLTQLMKDPEFTARVLANPEGPEARALTEAFPQGTDQTTLLTPESSGDELAFGSIRLPREARKVQIKDESGKVLTLEVDNETYYGQTRLLDIDDPKLQTQMLQDKGLVKVRDPESGKWVYGYRGNGEILPPDPIDNIPDAAPRIIKTAGTDVRDTSYHEIRDLLERRTDFLDSPEVATLVETIDGPPPPPADPLPGSRAELELAAGGAATQTPNVVTGGPRQFMGAPGKPPMPPTINEVPRPSEPSPGQMPQHANLKAEWTVRAGLKNATASKNAELADVAVQAYATKAFKDVDALVAKNFRDSWPQLASLPQPRQDAIQRSLNGFLDNKLSMQELLAQTPELIPSVARELEAKQSQIQAAWEDLAQNYFPALADPVKNQNAVLAGLREPNPDDLMSFVVQKQVRAGMTDAQWAKTLAADESRMDKLVKDAIAWYKAEGKFKKAGDEELADRARAAVEAAAGIRGVVPMPEVKGSFKLPSPELPAQSKLAPWQLEAAGLANNAFERIGATEQKLQQLRVVGEMFNDIKAKGWAVPVGPADTPPPGWLQVPYSPEYGNVAGNYIHPDAWDAVITAPAAQSAANSFLGKLQSLYKYRSTVLNPASWSANELGGMQGAMMSNLIDPILEPQKVVRGWVTMLDDMQAFRLQPGLGQKGVEAQRFETALKKGIVGSDFNTSDMQRSAGEYGRFLRKQAGIEKGWLELSLEFASQAKEKLGNTYGLRDQMWKYAAWSAGLEKGGIDLATGQLKDPQLALNFLANRPEAALFVGTPEASAVLKEMVETEAARRVSLSFPMHDRVGKNIARVANTALVGVANPYLKTTAEMWRNYAQLGNRFLNEPGMKSTLAKFTMYASLVGGGAYASRQLNGMESDELDAKWASAPDYVREFRPGPFSFGFRDDRGRAQFVDMSKAFEPLRYMSGVESLKDAPLTVTRNIFNSLTGDRAQVLSDHYLNSVGLGSKQLAAGQTPTYSQGLAAAASLAIKELGPRVIPAFLDVAADTGLLYNDPSRAGPDVGRQPAWTAVPNMLLGRGTVGYYGSKEDAQTRLQAGEYKINDATRAMGTIGAKTEGQKVPGTYAPFDKKAAFERQKAEIKRQVDEQRRLNDLFKKGIK